MSDGDLDVEVEQVHFKTGDVVRLKDKVLRDKEYRDMGPRRLISQGWPNHFYVDAVGIAKEKPVITLWGACCYTIENSDGSFKCKAHPASMFEKVRPEVSGEDRPRRKGDRTASVVTPLGEIASWRYSDDSENPGLIIKLFGKEFSATGAWLKPLAEAAKKKGLL